MTWTVYACNCSYTEPRLQLVCAPQKLRTVCHRKFIPPSTKPRIPIQFHSVYLRKHNKFFPGLKSNAHKWENISYTVKDWIYGLMQLCVLQQYKISTASPHLSSAGWDTRQDKGKLCTARIGCRCLVQMSHNGVPLMKRPRSPPHPTRQCSSQHWVV